MVELGLGRVLADAGGICTGVSSRSDHSGTVIFTSHRGLGAAFYAGRVWRQIRSVSSVKSLFGESVGTCYFLSRWLVNDRAAQGNINHTSRALDVTLIPSVWSYLEFSATHTRTHTNTHTRWYVRTDGFSSTDAWGRRIGFKNTRNICKALWLIILVLRSNHAIWAWATAEHEPYGKGGDEEASTILIKPWGPWIHAHTHTHLSLSYFIIYIRLLTLH